MRTALLVALATVLPVAARALPSPSPASVDGWLPLPTGTVSSVAFGSCSNQYLEQPIWDTLVDVGPDLFLHLGDSIYGDAAPPGTRKLDPSIDRIAKMRFDYQFLFTHPGFRRVRENIPFAMTWDDHDYGENDGGAEFALRAESRDVLFEFLQVPDDSPRRQREGVYDALAFGPPGKRLQVILLDTRSFRGPLTPVTLTDEERAERRIVGRYGESEGTTMLGAAQWSWLEEQLRAPADVRLIASSIQVVASEKGAESWGTMPAERDRLYALIEETRASGVVFLSGDVHFSELSRSDEGPYPLYDFTSSPLAQYPTGSTGWEDCVNSFRVGDPYVKDNFGLVTVDWERGESGTLVFALVGADGERHLGHEVDLAALTVE